MTKKELKMWNDRHYEICMMLLKDVSFKYDGEISNHEIKSTISRANRITQQLYKRERMISTKYDRKKQCNFINLIMHKIKMIIQGIYQSNQVDLTDNTCAIKYK